MDFPSQSIHVECMERVIFFQLTHFCDNFLPSAIVNTRNRKSYTCLCTRKPISNQKINWAYYVALFFKRVWTTKSIHSAINYKMQIMSTAL
jgi:hypothetical protein